MKKISFIVMAAVFMAGCNGHVCYTATDHFGNDIGEVCGSSENDCFNKVYGQVWNGAPITTKAQFEATFHKK